MAEVAENEVTEDVAGNEEVSAPVEDATTEDAAPEAMPDSAEENGADMSASVEPDAPEGDAPEAAASTPAPDAEGFTSSLPSISPDAAARKHVVGGVGYEIIYVVKAGDPALVEASSQRVRDLIEGSEGAVDNVRASEVRRFAYPIQKQNEGVYVVVNARFKPEFTGELDRYFKIEESILRHMMLKEDR